MCNCNCKKMKIISEILDAGKKLNDKCKQIEDVLDVELEVFHTIHDNLANVLRELLNVKHYTHESDYLFQLFFEYTFGIESSKEKTINKILSMSCCEFE